MKTVIAGGRDYSFTDLEPQLLDQLPITEVVSGGANGADKEGEKWAESRDIPVKVFPADWRAYGRSAGPMRNKQMAQYADLVVLFPGGKGTASMHSEAVRAGCQIVDFREATTS